MNKLTALSEAAKAATPGPWEQRSDGWTVRVVQPDTELERGWRIATTHRGGPHRKEEVSNATYIALANPTTILELCALLEQAEEALDGCLARLYGELYPNHPETLEVEEALAAIKQWKDQT